MPFSSINQPPAHTRARRWSPEQIAALRAEWARIMADARRRLADSLKWDEDDLARPTTRGRILTELGLPNQTELARRWGMNQCLLSQVLRGLMYPATPRRRKGRRGLPPLVAARLRTALAAAPHTGERTAAIARRCGVAPSTVRAHRLALGLPPPTRRGAAAGSVPGSTGEWGDDRSQRTG